MLKRTRLFAGVVGLLLLAAPAAGQTWPANPRQPVHVVHYSDYRRDVGGFWYNPNTPHFAQTGVGSVYKVQRPWEYHETRQTFFGWLMGY